MSNERKDTIRHSPFAIRHWGTRNRAMDAARGLAVLGMVVVHLVPTEGGNTLFGSACAAAARALEGVPAALFCLLAGMAWAIRADRAGPTRALYLYALRRSLALAALGVVVHVLVWPTEILVPFALMLVLSILIRRGGKGAISVATLSLLIAAPIIAAVWGRFVEADWTADGGHLADTSLGWVTVRYLLIDGNYPLVPWLAYPLIGMMMLAGDLSQLSWTRRWFWAGLAVTALARLLTWWSAKNAELLGDTGQFLASTWVPTSLPFVLICGGTAMAVIAGLAWREQVVGLPQACQSLSFVGRASLTHYLAHICLVFAPLRLAYPKEDWPLVVGVAAAGLYLVAALLFSPLWFRNHRRGPLEEILGRVSGIARIV